MAVCQACGLPFPQRSGYERACPLCFKVSKDYKILWGDQAFLWAQLRVAQLEAELCGAQEKLKVAQAKPPAPPKTPAELRGGLLRQVILLCHPDKHKNSEKATQVTKALLALRVKQTQKRKKT